MKPHTAIKSVKSKLPLAKKKKERDRKRELAVGTFGVTKCVWKLCPYGVRDG